MIIKPCKAIHGTAELPGDKSISHRAAILSSLAKGRTEIRRFLFSDDCLVTLSALKAMGVGVRIFRREHRVVIDSSGVLCPPMGSLNMNESGTSARMLMGLLAGQGFASRLTGAPSLLKRPMARVIKPLSLMGAGIQARRKGGKDYLPVSIRPSVLHGICWRQEVASAQVKSALLLAGLFAQGETCVHEAVMTRDHTERMLRFFGADLRMSGGGIVVKGGELTSPGFVIVPGDISSAAFFIVAALVLKGSRLVLKHVGVNPTRTGAIRVLQRMGGRIRLVSRQKGYEPAADLDIRFSRLCGTRIRSAEIPSLIDELPVLMVAASLAEGRTVIEGAGELRVKETDRIRSMSWNLKRAGVKIGTKVAAGREDIVITGSGGIKGAHFRSFGDHRTAMSMYVAALAASGVSSLDDPACVGKSFPEYFSVFKHLIAR
ncbi:3-phosphoshikimate 1-carboxyvinyltransferase [Candidatus Velamenicoccus archaeovorus]|nr:3-phosphoshikimate 1-carboxyvinyltransferase [Candidatus Velamenicoccus archaeovorus]